MNQTPWHTYTPLPFAVYYHSHPVVIVQRRTWQIATRLDLFAIRRLNEKHDPWVRWQRRTLANTLRQSRKPLISLLP